MMNLPNTNDDEDDFSLNPATRSRLSSLFEGGHSKSDVNQALTFTAPKQPKKNDGSQEAPQETYKLISSTTVHAYKTKDGKYENQGKLGCAILGLHKNFSYKFLLYKSKQSQLVACSITSSFIFQISANNYVNLYDENKEAWAINFDNETVLSDFAKQIALCKANSQGSTINMLVVQDLFAGEGPSLDNKDAAEIKYTGWILENQSFGKMFDSNMNSDAPFRLRLGKSKVIKGWHEGLIGAQKNCRRLLIIPSGLAYGSEGLGDSVPPNSVLIFEMMVQRVKLSHDSTHSNSPAKDHNLEKKPEVMPRHSISQEDNVRMRGESFYFYFRTQSPKKDKAQLISRMAKMGTATLPLPGAIVAQVNNSSSESEGEVAEESSATVASNSRTASPKLLPKTSSRSSSIASIPAQTSQQLQETQFIPSPQVAQMPTFSQPPMMSQPMTPYMTQTPFPALQTQVLPQFGSQYPVSLADAHMPLLLTETRTNNAEVRLGLSKVADKVDTVMQKIDDLRLNQGRSSTSTSTTYMDSATLAHNIERIVQENKQLREDSEAKNSKIEALNAKIHDLYQRNQGFLEESNTIMEQKSETLQAVSVQSNSKLLNLEQEKAKLSSDLTEMVEKLKNSEAKLQHFIDDNTLLLQKVQESENEVKAQQSALVHFREQSNDLNAESEALLNSLKEELKTVEEEKSVFVEKCAKLEMRLEEMDSQNDSLRKDVLDRESSLEEIKAHKSESDQKYTDRLLEEKENLKAELSEAISEKTIQLKKIEELQEMLKESDQSLMLCKEQLSDMQSQLEESLVWKKKYENLFGKTRVMKEKYEIIIKELHEQISQLRISSTSSQDSAPEIRKMMNVLYKSLQSKFDLNASYTGKQVLDVMLENIRVLTFQMLEMKRRSSTNSTDSDSKSVKSTDEVTKVKDVEESVQHTEGKAETIIAEGQLNGAATEMQIGDAGSEGGKGDAKEQNVVESINGNKTTVLTESAENDSEANVENQDQNLAVSENLESKTESQRSSSPDRNSDQSAESSLSADCSKILWKPQPPPLFDDDEDEDDDDWLK